MASQPTPPPNLSPLNVPPQKEGLNKTLLRETNGGRLTSQNNLPSGAEQK